jgi:hypothetical protein
MGIVLEEGAEAVEIFGMSCEAGIRKEFRMLLEPMHRRNEHEKGVHLNTLATDAKICIQLSPTACTEIPKMILRDVR